ncbi:MAG: Maf family protein [Luteimonas sp.]
MQLLLASTSPYRRELLARLRLTFKVARPDIDESPHPGEKPIELVQRLARAKAVAVATSAGHAWVLGSDQVAELDGRPLGKPGDADGAIAQLTALSGRTIPFHTAVALVQSDGRVLAATDTTHVRLRKLSQDEIARYVAIETPFDCAGSFKCEALGIALFEAVATQDPTALVGLPLIATARLLREAGFTVP